jgi:hypothetical protein
MHQGVFCHQIIGLTASPGVGRARGKNVDDAVNYLKQLCARLDVSDICSVRQQEQDLKNYVNIPKTGEAILAQNLFFHAFFFCEKKNVSHLFSTKNYINDVIDQDAFFLNLNYIVIKKRSLLFMYNIHLCILNNLLTF